jgi:drug/metabolite transporter (DMT)-like permease
MEAQSDPSVKRRRTLGLALIVLGLIGILWGVFHVLDRVDPMGQRAPADRQTYNQVKVVVHERFLGGLVRSLAGLGLALLGGRIRSRAGAAPQGR